MPDPNDALLDLSAWPAPRPSARPPARPPAVPPARPPAPPVPPRLTAPRRPRRRPGLRPVAFAVLALGFALLLVPTPGCGPSLAARLARSTPLPTSAAPALDDAQVAADAAAVRTAEAALAAWHPPATKSPAPVATKTVSEVDAHELAAAQADLTAADRQVDADQADLDRLLAAQEESSDPGAYDDRVAAAREQLDASVVRRDEARRALAAVRPKTVTVRVPTAPRPSASPAPARAPLVEAVTEARQVQAAHLAARQKQLAAWRARLQASTSRITAHNAHVRACGRQSAVPVWGGLALLVLGAAGLLRHRLTV